MNNIQIESNLCFMPTAISGYPHLGHLWYLINLASLHAEITSVRGASPDLWKNLSTKLFLFIDNYREDYNKTIYEDSYREMLEWLGFEFELIEFSNFRSQVFARNGEVLMYFLGSVSDASNIKDLSWIKPIFFDIANIRWHLRGTDIHELCRNEKTISNLLRLRAPKFLYISLLANQDGAPLNASLIEEGQMSKTYKINDLFPTNAYKVIIALFRAMSTSPAKMEEANSVIANATEYTRADITTKRDWMKVLCRRFWSQQFDISPCTLPIIGDFDGKLSIAEDWRKFIA